MSAAGSKVNSKVSCDGCGKAHVVDAYSGDAVWSGEVAVGRPVTLCMGKCSGDPKIDCYGKVLWKARACPGCGKSEGKHALPGILCQTCLKNLAEGEKQNHAAKVWAERVEVPVDVRVRLDMDDESQVKYVSALARAVSGRGTEEPEVRHRMTTAELTDGQRKALAEFDVVVSDMVEAAYETGLKAGRDLLGGLARGEISVGQINEDAVSGPRSKRLR